MDRTGTKFANSILVLWCGVALVTGKTVAWIDRIDFCHQPVAIHLRDYGRGSDRKIESVTFIETVLWLTDSGDGAAIHENVLRLHWEVLQRNFHGLQSRMINIDPVDLFDFDDTHSNGGRFLPDFRIQPQPR